MSTDTIRVILADDHAVVRKGIREFLAEPGDIEVVAEASDGDKAIALIEQRQPDVAVLDIQMPKRSGIDVCRHIRAQQWPVGILVLCVQRDLLSCDGANALLRGLITTGCQALIERVDSLLG